MRVLVWLVLMCACERGPEPGPPAMPQAEKDRAVEICRTYVARLCACAGDDAALREACDLARAQPEAVAMHLTILAGKGPKGQLAPEERALMESSLRKIVAACVRGDAELDPHKCPRK
ncbi:MAG TPA: hypothetical protein VKE22_01250 [Haliangiales bacterium]|nr:hypothetical protein [Haliangiales bacterium]